MLKVGHAVCSRLYPKQRQWRKETEFVVFRFRTAEE
jgi:hypothetical protein